jgi:Flp pilus assembly protein CpaB
MRPRTIILLVLVLVVGAVAGYLVLDRFVLNPPQTPGETQPAEEVGEEPGIPVPAATPAPAPVPVVIAKIDIPIGERIRLDLVEIEERPDDNIALRGEFAFSDPAMLEGMIVRVPISKGQEILRDMVADNPTDIVDSGSDLALLIGAGKVAVAFPIDKFSGTAYALRPGDLVDAMMTVRVVEIDPEFNTALPNITQRVIESELLAGQAFLFPETTQGRLEFVTDINQVVELVPSDEIAFQDTEPGKPIPKRVTQLTIQQAEVLWVGTWRDPREFEKAAEDETAAPDELALESEEADVAAEGIAEEAVPERFETKPDVIILGMFTQDALAMKWALERGIDIDLALRAQGDTTPFVTTGVSLPEIIAQGNLVVPEPADFDLYPRVDDIKAPGLPANPPSD